MVQPTEPRAMTDESAGPSAETVALVAPLAPDRPGRELPLMPGDLSKYVRQGLGLGVAPVIRPWDDPIKVLGAPDYYGFDAPERDPIRGAPSQLAAGGLLYFDDGCEADDLQAALRIIGVHVSAKDYAVFEAHPEDTIAERYLYQVRIITKSALGHFFRVRDDAAKLPPQPLAIGDYIAWFVAAQKNTWNAPRYAFR